ncbi:hypothetical protein DFH06DRAFT_1128656 [Mycena polygramma]|nr:hypothetical protein DFH06DRAFT_1128656 [Mycena polygramma]
MAAHRGGCAGSWPRLRDDLKFSWCAVTGAHFTRVRTQKGKNGDRSRFSRSLEPSEARARERNPTMFDSQCFVRALSWNREPEARGSSLPAKILCIDFCRNLGTTVRQQTREYFSIKKPKRPKKAIRSQVICQMADVREWRFCDAKKRIILRERGRGAEVNMQVFGEIEAEICRSERTSPAQDKINNVPRSDPPKDRIRASQPTGLTIVAIPASGVLNQGQEIPVKGPGVWVSTQKRSVNTAEALATGVKRKMDNAILRRTQEADGAAKPQQRPQNPSGLRLIANVRRGLEARATAGNKP